MTDEINKTLPLILINNDDSKEDNNASKSNEHYALIVGILAQFIWAVNGIQLKSYKQWFPEAFSNNSLVFWRSVPIWFLGYLFAKKNNINITSLNQIKHLKWFLSRNIGAYFGVVLWVTMLKYFRVSTCQCISSCHPIIVVLLSIVILKERFYVRYLAGVLICIIGTVIIVLNEKNPPLSNNSNNDDKINDSDIIIGLLICITHLFTVSFISLGQKVLCNDHITPEEQNYYLGMLNTLPALIVSIFECNLGLNNIVYVLYAISNGFLIYLGNHFTAIALNHMPLSTFIPLTYLCIVFVFLLGLILLHEAVYLTDFIGSLIILSYQLYNVWVPLSK